MSTQPIALKSAISPGSSSAEDELFTHWRGQKDWAINLNNKHDDTTLDLHNSSSQEHQILSPLSLWHLCEMGIFIAP